MIEADHRKCRGDVDVLDKHLAKHRSDSQMQLKRHGEEIERTIREGTFGRDHELGRAAKEHQTIMSNLDNKLQQVRNESLQANHDLIERSRILEVRCSALEKEHGDKWEQQVDKEFSVINRLSNAQASMESTNMERIADAADLRTTAVKVDELMQRMHHAESSLHCKVQGDHWVAQLENFAQVMHKHESKMAGMEREFNMRMAQEAQLREELMYTLHGSVKTAFDKISPQGGNGNGNGNGNGQDVEGGSVHLVRRSSLSTASPAIMPPQRARSPSCNSSTVLRRAGPTSGVATPMSGTICVSSPRPTNVHHVSRQLSMGSPITQRATSPVHSGSPYSQRATSPVRIARH